MNKRVWRFAAVLMAVSAAWALAASDVTTRVRTESPFTAEAYQAHVKYLADDKLAGRRPGTDGIELAAEYIARQFAAAGLTPAGDEGGWFQKFDVRRGKKLVEEEALLKIEGIEREWEVRKDWIPLPFTVMEDVTGPLAFAGFGIEADLHEYNDYADFDAEGKILLVFRYEPQGDDPEADFGGRDPSHYSLFNVKARMAAQHGAKALLIVNPPKRPGVDDALFEFSEEYTNWTYDLPLVHVSRAIGEAIVKQAGLPSLEKLQEKLEQQRKPLSADLKLDITLKIGVKPNLLPTRNVIGLLKGEDASDETIVVGAHYDHLGNVARQFDRTDDTPEIHNGADDNASGTATVIELARVLGRERGLRRSVLFIAFSAEEMGLLGSRHFMEHPTVPAEGLRAMVNFDMVGRFSQNKFVVFGIPSAVEFPEVVSRAAEHAGVEYRTAKGVAGNSDHAAFYHEQIPVLFACTGVHQQYHRPEDDWQLIDAPGAARILDMFREIVRELADMDVGPTFQEVTAKPAPEDLEMKPGIEHAQPAPGTGKDADAGRPGGDVQQPEMPKVRLGIIPDFVGSDEPGLVIDTVLDGGAAKAAGLQDGDRVIRIGEYKVMDIYGYMRALREFKPGNKVDVVVVRKGKEIKVQVELKAGRRPQGQRHKPK